VVVPIALLPPDIFLQISANPSIARTCIQPDGLLLLLLLPAGNPTAAVGVAEPSGFRLNTKPSARFIEPVVMVPVLSSAMVLQAAKASKAAPDLIRMPLDVMAAMAQAYASGTSASAQGEPVH
jgi:hypothetical protein